MNDLTDTYSEQMFEVKTSKVPGVLGVATGPHFFPNSPSRNRRVYPYEAWTNALSNPYTTRLLENKLMLGTVGHADMEFDELIREGKVSHRVTKLWMEKQPDGKFIGLGEAEILDTPVGRILYTLMNTGSKMAVSSKSYGEYNSQDESGNQIVDSAKFFCQRFDFVVDPGFLDAKPELREAFNEAFSRTEHKYSTDKQEERMDQEMMKLMEEKIKVEHQLAEVLTENAKMKEESFPVSNLRDQVIDLSSQLEEANEAVESLMSVVEAFRAKGETPEDIEETFKKTVRLVERIDFLGGFGHIESVMHEHDKLVSSLSKLGGPELIADTLEKSAMMVERLESMNITSLNELEEVLEKSQMMVEEIEKYGSFAIIKEALEKSNRLMHTISEKSLRENVDTLVATSGISEENARKLVKKHGLEEAKSIIREMREPQSTRSRYTRMEEDRPSKDINNSSLNESRASRLFGSYRKVDVQNSR